MDTPQLSVQEIIGIGRSPYTGFWGTLSLADQKIVDEAIRQTGIQHLAFRSITELSGLNNRIGVCLESGFLHQGVAEIRIRCGAR